MMQKTLTKNQKRKAQRKRARDAKVCEHYYVTEAGLEYLATTTRCSRCGFKLAEPAPRSCTEPVLHQ